MTNPLVTVVMPAYNAERFIKSAIDSVLGQSYQNIEVIVVNDGSTDWTRSIIEGIDDDRLLLVNTQNQGVSSARNEGLSRMSGDFFCTCDADDILPANSISSRVDLLLNDESAAFADGAMIRTDVSGEIELSRQVPSFAGWPRRELIRMTGSCFSGSTWMVRRKSGFDYRFDQEISHGEDLLFYISIADQGEYVHTDEPIIRYRTVPGSAMHDLAGIERGYRQLLNILRSRHTDHQADIEEFWRKTRWVLFRSYLKAMKPLNAVRVLLTYK